MSLVDKLQWRYATKKMDSSKVVPEAKLENILIEYILEIEYA